MDMLYLILFNGKDKIFIKRINFFIFWKYMNEFIFYSFNNIIKGMLSWTNKE